jgi:hypothetical protein
VTAGAGVWADAKAYEESGAADAAEDAASNQCEAVGAGAGAGEVAAEGGVRVCERRR